MPIASVEQTRLLPLGGMSGKLSRQNLLGAFLGKFLCVEGLSKAELCKRLDVAQPQLTQWLNGHNSIPPIQLSELKEALFLGNDEFTTLHYLNNIVVLRLMLDRLLTGGRRRKGASQAGLAGYLSGGKSVLAATLRFCEDMADKDLAVYPAMHWSEALYKHINVAFQVARDIDQFLKTEEPTIFTPRNITAHLQYPYNYHVGFYLSDIKALALPNVPGLQEQVWDSIFLAARGLSSDDMLESRIAQHATHIIHRYGPSSYDGGLILSRKMTLETHRMALFGRVYKDEDTGDFERLTHAIKTSVEFSGLVLAFDGLHYGDYLKWTVPRMADTLSRNDRIPARAFMVHLNDLGSTKAFLRNLAAARLDTMLDRFGAKMATPRFLRAAEAARERVGQGKIADPSVEAAFCKVDAWLSQAKGGD